MAAKVGTSKQTRLEGPQVIFVVQCKGECQSRIKSSHLNKDVKLSYKGLTSLPLIVFFFSKKAGVMLMEKGFDCYAGIISAAKGFSKVWDMYVLRLRVNAILVYAANCLRDKN